MSCMSEDNVLAVLISDIHLSHTPPVARSTEDDWYAVQEKYLDELRSLCIKYDCPLLCAGDIFDKWNSPAELINLALKSFTQFPHEVYSVAGQHDLPYHNLEDIKKSAYWTLVEAGAIEHLNGQSITYTGSKERKLQLVGLPWEQDDSFARKVKLRNENYLNVLIMHRYVWSNDHNKYPGVGSESHAVNIIKRYKNFGVIHTGDNHKSFIKKQQGNVLVNCGSFMRRTIDEVNHSPVAGLLCNNGRLRIKPHILDTINDSILITDVPDTPNVDNLDMSELLKELRNLQRGAETFNETIRKSLMNAKVSSQARELINKVLDEGSN